jgi:hypothetical protein
MAENTRCQSSITVPSFQYTDNPPIDSESFLLCHPHNIGSELGVEFGWNMDMMSLHAGAFPFASVKSRRDEDCCLGLRAIGNAGQSLSVHFQECASLVYQN